MFPRHFFRQKLQGHKATQFGVFGLVHHSHPATPNLLEDAVARDGFSDHGLGGQPVVGGAIIGRDETSSQKHNYP
jgi:hypothetical protein